MGYRSELVIAIPKKIRAECMLDNSWPKLLPETPIKEDKDIQYWIVDGIKWYTGVYPEVDELDAFLHLHSADDCIEEREGIGAIRLGEEFGDVETWGDPSEYDIYVNQSIDFD